MHFWSRCSATYFLIGIAFPIAAAGANPPNQSALAPASDQALDVASLWWAMLTGATIIFVLVLALLATGLWRARRQGRELSRLHSRNLVIIAGVAIPLVVLIFLVGGSLLLGKSLSAQPPADALTIEVTGWRWWWEVKYLDSEGRPLAITANEIHVPLNKPVRLLLRSEDVIHSFWVPNLHGKTDMVPGTTNTSWFTARTAGIYRGQCAEFCGTQHALMGFLVKVQPQVEFEAWLQRQSKDARQPQTEAHRHGRQVFLDAGCARCHTIRGVTRPEQSTTAAEGTGPAEGQGAAEYPSVPAPDLTHFGSRRTLAAAVRPRSRGHLGGWIADPQGIKPGALMPPTLLDSKDLNTLTDYLLNLE